MFHNNWLTEGSVKTPLALQGEKMDIYFKKPDGEIFKFMRGKMALKSCQSKFIECDKSGKEIKKVSKKKAKVKDGK